MKDKTGWIKEADIEEFREYLLERENAAATVEKYIRDVRKFFEYTGGGEINKERLLAYKDWLVENYAISSANSMLVALNQFLVFMEMGRFRLKRLKVQRLDIEAAQRSMSREEFRKLVRTARDQGKEQLALMLETICGTGIRISELKYFRVDTIRSGVVKVWNKGKYRLVILPELLRKKLLIYIRKEHIRSGIIFCTRSGQEKDRSNIWREMKVLAKSAGVKGEKVFPHNLRHLFARTFYTATKNLINLADILGHSNIEVTRIYASEGIDEWKRNIEKMKLLECTT